MIFSAPLGFEEALQSARVKALLPTSLNSAQLRRIAPALRERAFFSARTANADYLARIQELINKILAPESLAPGGYVDPALARLELKTMLGQLGYAPEPGAEGTITDLSSDRRLNLIIDTNVRMARGYGFWAQGQDPSVLDAWPAQELFRGEERDEKRVWGNRWNDGIREIGLANTSAKPVANPLAEDGMFALKNDQIWTQISAFGLPYPPFDFNSGMDVRDVDRETAVAMGLIGPDDQVAPESRGFNEDLEAAPPDGPQGALFAALLESLGPRAHFVDGALTLLDE